MPEKSRRPERDFYFTDYVPWVGRVSNWVFTQTGEPDYPSTLATGFAPLVTAVSNALTTWDALNQSALGKNDVYTTASDALNAQLILVKTVLPNFFKEPPILSEFGLNRVIPKDRDDLYFMAKTCVEHWQAIIVPVVPPAYAPVESDMNNLVTVYGELVTARNDYNTTFNLAASAKDFLLEKRADCHERERKIFNWYKARHQDGQDHWWTTTEWGCTPGGEGEGETGEPFPAAPQNFKVTHNLAPSMNNLKWDILTGAATYTVLRGISPIGMPQPMLMIWMSGIEENSALDPAVPPGSSYYYQVYGVDSENVEGDKTEVVKVDVVV